MDYLETEDLVSEWKEDCQWDEILLDQSSIRIPALHSKWVAHLTHLKKQLRLLKTLKRECRRGDEDYKTTEEKIASTTDAIDLCERNVYQLNQWTYNIGNIIRWRCHLKGVDVL